MTVAAAAKQAIKLSWLDLRGSRLSVIERLCLEEALLRHDKQNRSWAILGTHDPLVHRYINPRLPSYIHASEDPNPTCIVVMGIGGKPHALLNLDLIQQDGVAVIKRFSGGGTVVLDPSSIWTTFIGRNEHFPHVEPYPKSIMQWSADDVFTPAFDNLKQHYSQSPSSAGEQRTLIPDSKSCSPTDNLGTVLTIPSKEPTPPLPPSESPLFSLRENDYVLGNRKMGGNAQSIVKGGWLHHTSFLWDYQDEHMGYLTIPNKRPEYRGDRHHSDFLVKLNQYYGNKSGVFFESVQEACRKNFDVEEVTLREAMEVVNDLGGMQEWFEKSSRTRILDDFGEKPAE
jgi:lipoate-protein ligase A